MKKSLSAIIAAAMAATALLAPTTANAYWTIDGDSDDIARATKGYTEIYDIDFFDWTFHGREKSEDYHVYVNEDGTHFRTFDKESDSHDIHVKLADGINKEEVENELYEKYSENYEKVQFWLEIDNKNPGYYFLMRNCTNSNITMQEAIEYLNFMKEQELICDGKLITNTYQMRDIVKPYEGGLMTYQIVNGTADLYGKLIDYVDKEIDGYQVATTYSNDDYCWIELVPPNGQSLDDISLDEKLEISRKIYEATHLEPNLLWRQSSATVGGGDGIDVCNGLKGDANCDGKVTIADPVAILQSIANNDKYALSAQGKFNGDVTGEYDGLTAADAYELQVIDSQK